MSLWKKSCKLRRKATSDDRELLKAVGTRYSRVDSQNRCSHSSPGQTKNKLTASCRRPNKKASKLHRASGFRRRLFDVVVDDESGCASPGATSRIPSLRLATGLPGTPKPRFRSSSETAHNLSTSPPPTMLKASRAASMLFSVPYTTFCSLALMSLPQESHHAR